MTERRDRAHRWVRVGIWCLAGMSFVVSAALVGFVALMIAAGMSSPGHFGPEIPEELLFLSGVVAIGSGTAVAVRVARTSRRRPLDQLTQRAIAGYALLF